MFQVKVSLLFNMFMVGVVRELVKGRGPWEVNQLLFADSWHR